MDSNEYITERAVLADAAEFEGGKMVLSEKYGVVVAMDSLYKCVFVDTGELRRFLKRLPHGSEVCLLGAPENTPELLRVKTSACKTFAYFEPMPPLPRLPDGVVIKRLAPSLAQTVADAYGNPAAGYDADKMAEIMREKGVFGAIADGKLAGFIGRHEDGNMGMLEVFDGYRKRGIGEALEKFLIGYVMTFGRAPLCDVFCDNIPSLNLQKKIGLVSSDFHTFWFKV